MTASIDGTLAGDADLDGGCIWLEGSDGEMSSVVWAFPVFLLTEDMALVDEDGAVRADVGDRVLLGGGNAPGETIDRCMVSDDLVQTWSLHVEGTGCDLNRPISAPHLTGQEVLSAFSIRRTWPVDP